MMEKFRQRAYQLGLWTRMALGISLGFLVLFVAFSALGESALRESINRLREERLGFARLTASNLDRLLEQSIAELDFALSFADFNPDDPSLSDEQHVLEHTLGRGTFFNTGVFFLDQAGRVLLSYPPDYYAKGTDLSGKPYIAQALAEGHATVSQPFLSQTTGGPITAITMPLLQDGQVVGAVSGLLDFEHERIRGFLEETASFAQTGHSLLVDQDGRVIISSTGAPFLSPGDHQEFYRQAVAAGEAVVEVVPLEAASDPHQEHLMAIAPLRMVHWGVAVGGNVDEIFAGVQRLRLGIAVLGGVVLLATWGLTLIGARRLVKPVQRMTVAAQSIAAGELATSLEAPEGGEIGKLAAALDHMRRQLLAHIEELAQAKNNLEDQVTRRTEALRHQEALARQLLRRSMEIQEKERARISRELHDETGQTLTAIQINIDRLRRRLPEDAQDQLVLIQFLTEQVVIGLREIIADLRPGVLDQLGLVPALDRITAHALQPLGIQTAIEAIPKERRLPHHVETALFRIAQEAVNNVIHHSRASHFTIQIEVQEDQVIMHLADDGLGFNPLSVGVDPEFKRGLGLASMQERASLIGGKVTVETGPRRGTIIHVIAPLNSIRADQE